MNYEILKAEERAANLTEKFEIKSYSETWKPLRAFIIPVAFVIQLITAALAVALPAYGIKVITGSWILGFLVGGIVLAIFEIVKRLVVNKTMLQLYRNKLEAKKAPVAGFALVAVIVAASVASSTFGTPILVEEFSPVPAPFNEEAVLIKYDSLRTEASLYWQDIKKESLAKSKELQSKTTYKGVISWKAQSGIMKIEEQAAATVDSLNNALAVIAVAEAKALEAGAAERGEEIAEAEAAKSVVGIGLAFVTLVFECIFILCFLWLNYYDFREALEKGLVSFKSSKSFTKSSKSSSNSRKSSSKSSKVEVAAAQRIGFNTEVEGKIVEEAGKLKILCSTRSGLKAYDKAYLSTLISATKGQKKNSYWKEKKEELERAL